MGIALFLALILIPSLILLADKISQDRRHRHRRAGYKHSNTQSPPNIEDHQARAHEYKHREDEKVFWSRSICGSVITAVIASTALIVAWFSFDDAHKALIVVQRAFVFSGDSNEILHREGPDKWRLTPFWENSGNTPTKKLEVQTHCLETNHIYDDPETASSIENHTRGIRLAGPHETIPGVSCDLNNNLIAMINNGLIVFYVTRIATYTDSFDKKHITKRCDRIDSFRGDPNQGALTYEAFPCKTNNCADEECE